MVPRRVTVIDDSLELLELFQDVFGAMGAEVSVFDRIVSTDEIVATAPDLVVVDLRLGTDSLPGWDIIRQAREDAALRDCPVVVCSAALDQMRRHEEEVDRIPHTYLLPKPFSVDDLEEVIDLALGASGLRPVGPGHEEARLRGDQAR